MFWPWLTTTTAEALPRGGQLWPGRQAASELAGLRPAATSSRIRFSISFISTSRGTAHTTRRSSRRCRPCIRSPKSQAEEGEDQLPGAGRQRGALCVEPRRADVKRDQRRTSNTIMVVEVEDQHAVIWTKPDDLAFDPKTPSRASEACMRADSSSASATGGPVSQREHRCEDACRAVYPGRRRGDRTVLEVAGRNRRVAGHPLVGRRACDAGPP